MKIICDSPGQTCNRLWSYIPTLSECIVKKKRVAILFFDETIEQFPNFLHSRYTWFPLFCKRFLHSKNGWNKFKGLTWKLCHQKAWERFWIFTRCTYGWHQRGVTRYINEAKSELRRIFTPSEEIVERCRQSFLPYRESNTIIVGVHIRRGDYKTWNGGQFYFENKVYIEYMQQITRLFKNQSVCFYISSNEKIDATEFEHFHRIMIPNAGVVDDLYALSQCDYIIGPVSTFSRWASFIGERPLCFLYGPSQQLSLDDFSPIQSFFRFKNGKEILDW